jgi:hypothetical protein
MPKVQHSTSSRLQNFVSEFKDTFKSDGHVLFCVLLVCGHFFFLMHINAYYNAYFKNLRSIFVYFLELSP